MLARRFSIAIVLLLAAAGCHPVGGGVPGSGVAKTETRDVGTFDEIEFSGAGNLEIIVGRPAPLKITGDDNLLPLIETAVSGGRLSIGAKQSFNPKTELVVNVGTADLKSVNISGAASATVTGVNNESFKVDLSGAGSLKLAGQTGRFELSISGAASVDAVGLAARDVVANISGAGNADVQAVESLNASISGAGGINYTGDPKVEQQISGVGSVRKKAGALQAEAEELSL